MLGNCVSLDMQMKRKDLRDFLESKYMQYNLASFIEHDPIAVPHQFRKRQDIEIAGFLSATIAWGNRKSILSNGMRLVRMMDLEPYSFVMNASAGDLKPFRAFVHRTFNGDDCIFFITSLREIYLEHESMETLFLPFGRDGAREAITRFRRRFLSAPHLHRSEKHLSDPSAGSAAKRMNMFLRWMVRKDDRGVDFGLWDRISPADLVCPLDIHSGNTARKLGLLKRRQNDWTAAEELTAGLRKLDPADPVKYDLALFGLGVFEKF